MCRCEIWGFLLRKAIEAFALLHNMSVVVPAKLFKVFTIGFKCHVEDVPMKAVIVEFWHFRRALTH